MSSSFTRFLFEHFRSVIAADLQTWNPEELAMLQISYHTIKDRGNYIGSNALFATDEQTKAYLASIKRQMIARDQTGTIEVMTAKLIDAKYTGEPGEFDTIVNTLMTKLTALEAEYERDRTKFVAP